MKITSSEGRGLARRGQRLPMAHVAEVLDAAVRGATPASLLERR
jgi:hypothetical protein